MKGGSRQVVARPSRRAREQHVKRSPGRLHPGPIRVLSDPNCPQASSAPVTRRKTQASKQVTSQCLDHSPQPLLQQTSTKARRAALSGILLLNALDVTHTQREQQPVTASSALSGRGRSDEEGGPAAGGACLPTAAAPPADGAREGRGPCLPCFGSGGFAGPRPTTQGSLSLPPLRPLGRPGQRARAPRTAPLPLGDPNPVRLQAPPAPAASGCVVAPADLLRGLSSARLPRARSVDQQQLAQGSATEAAGEGRPAGWPARSPDAPPDPAERATGVPEEEAERLAFETIRQGSGKSAEAILAG